MEVVILCGGSGTRMQPECTEDAKNHPETEELPKSMIPIGARPIVWHIMNLYSKYGHTDFVLLVGFKGDMVENYFNDPKNRKLGWKITYSNAGADATKGDRIRKAYKEGKIKGDKFLLAYGDDLCNVNINDVIGLHNKSGKLVTLTSVRLVSDFGIIELDDADLVKSFKEKPILDDYWINGGYIVMDKAVVEYMIKNDGDETDAFEALAKEGEVQVFKYFGFWKSMNTIKDMKVLRDMWKLGELQKQLGIDESDC